jgi:hypothetical protein
VGADGPIDFCEHTASESSGRLQLLAEPPDRAPAPLHPAPGTPNEGGKEQTQPPTSPRSDQYGPRSLCPARVT